MQSGISLIGNKVKFGGISIDKFTKEYQTPLLIFCEKRLIDNYKALAYAFRKHYEKTSIFYSIKTNFEPQILMSLKEAGSNAEAASALEVLLALKAGFTPKQIVLDGPAWTDEDIEFCIRKGIKTMNVDSVDLMKRVNSVAKKLKKKVDVGFRIFPEIKMSILKSFAEGYIKKFGVPLSQAIDAYKVVKNLDYVNPIAISSHIGSMITDPMYYEREVEKFTKLARDLKNILSIDISEINLGGGYGVQSLNYFSIQNIILSKAGVAHYSKAASIEEFGERIASRFKQNLKKYSLPEIDLILEPGRFIASDAGIMLTNVVSVKNNWVFINGGANLLPESIFFIRRGFIVANKVKKPNIHTYGIAGPTLNTIDILADNQKLPKMEVGDTVIVLDAGAYSLSRSTQFTMLRPDAIYIKENGKIKYLRKKEKPQDFIDKLLL